MVKAICFLILNVIIAISVCIMIICKNCNRINVQRFDTSLADNTEALDDDDSEEEDIEEKNDAPKEQSNNRQRNSDASS